MNTLPLSFSVAYNFSAISCSLDYLYSISAAQIINISSNNQKNKQILAEKRSGAFWVMVLVRWGVPPARDPIGIMALGRCDFIALTDLSRPVLTMLGGF